MIDTPKKFEKEMRKTIKEVLENNMIDTKNTNDEVLCECIKREYISGIEFQRYLLGKVRFEFGEKINITYKGLLFYKTKYPKIRDTLTSLGTIFAAIIALIALIISL